MKRKTPKVEAWAVVAGAEVLAGFSRESEALSRRLDEAALRSDHTLRVVHLVEADPDKERVVRLERKAIALARVLVAALWGNGKPCAAGEAELRVTLARLTSAVEKFQKGRRK